MGYTEAAFGATNSAVARNVGRRLWSRMAAMLSPFAARTQ